MSVPADLNWGLQFQEHWLLKEDSPCHCGEPLYLMFLQGEGLLIINCLCEFDDNVININDSIAFWVLHLSSNLI